MMQSPSDQSTLPSYEELVHRVDTIYQQNKSIQRRLTYLVIASYIKLLLILIPLIVGIIYLPPLFTSLFEQYGALLSTASSLDPAFVEQLQVLLKSSLIQQ